MEAVLGSSFANLSPPEKLSRYRLFAENALERANAANADPELHAGFLIMASGWHELAVELEAMMRTGGLLPMTPPGPGTHLEKEMG